MKRGMCFLMFILEFLQQKTNIAETYNGVQIAISRMAMQQIKIEKF